MRIATYQHRGRRQVGLVAPDGLTITPLQIDEAHAARGALILFENLSHSADELRVPDERVPLSEVKLEAPLPLPRRNIFCVGRNYRAHAKELSRLGVQGQQRRRPTPGRSSSPRCPSA